jgi:DNA polymerase elongation subunit (family B)
VRRIVESIAGVLIVYSGESDAFVRNVFTLNTCANIVGSQVISFKDEKTMLESWQKFVEQVDPDMVIGYNSSNFDLPYLLDRARAVKADKFPYLGRIISVLFSLQSRNMPNENRLENGDEGHSLLVEGFWPA